MNKFYIYIKTLSAFLMIFLLTIICLVLPSSISDQKYFNVLILLIVVVGLVTINISLLVFYSKRIISVSFIDEKTILATNVKKYELPSKNFTQVEDTQLCRIVFTYADDFGERKFVCQTRYSPFKKYSLNISEIKDNMTNARFVGFND